MQFTCCQGHSWWQGVLAAFLPAKPFSWFLCVLLFASRISVCFQCVLILHLTWKYHPSLSISCWCSKWCFHDVSRSFSHAEHGLVKLISRSQGFRTRHVNMRCVAAFLRWCICSSQYLAKYRMCWVGRKGSSSFYRAPAQYTYAHRQTQLFMLYMICKYRWGCLHLCCGTSRGQN